MKKKPPEHENLERWMVSYADFMTLLFALFVVLYAFAMAKQSDAKAMAEATAIVPLLKFSNSNTPIGPFHITVLASLTASAYKASVLGPISNPMLPAGMF